MTDNTSNLSRRNFLKGFTYTTALSLGGFSSLAFASSGLNKAKPMASGICGVSVSQQKLLDKESVTLMNQSDESIILNALEPIGLERVNDSLVIKVNQVDSNTLAGIKISPSQRVAFDIQAINADFPNIDLRPSAINAGSHLQVTSEHAAFNNIVPVQSV